MYKCLKTISKTNIYFDRCWTFYQRDLATQSSCHTYLTIDRQKVHGKVEAKEVKLSHSYLNLPSLFHFVIYHYLNHIYCAHRTLGQILLIPSLCQQVQCQFYGLATEKVQILAIYQLCSGQIFIYLDWYRLD